MGDDEKINVEDEQDEQGEQEPASDPVPADAPADDGPGGGSTEGPGK